MELHASPLTLVLVALSFLVSVAVHRLFFNPIAKFPGPRLAAVSFLYECYYDVVCKGQYTWKIQELHRQYGPVVRINPYELHINDPSFYDQVYVGPTQKTQKWQWSAKMFGTSLATVGTTSHELHRVRRGALNPFFSKQSVTKFESTIQQNVDLLRRRLATYAETNQSVNLVHAFSALSADIISDFAFGKSYGYLMRHDVYPEWHTFMMDLSKNTHLMKHFGQAFPLVKSLPEWLVSFVHPITKRLFDLQHSIEDSVRTITAEAQCESFLSPNDGELPTRNRPSIFHDILSTKLPPQEKTNPRLSDEGLTLIAAGTVTTAWALSVTVYHILSQPAIHTLLRTELSHLYATSPNPRWKDFEHLPYLTACLTEGLRLSFGVSTRLPRISPDLPLQYGKWTIPRGTPVSMTQMFIHLDPSIFPRPTKFLPERWLSACNRDGKSGDMKTMRHFLVSFSRGTRSCVGRDLAWAEMYLVLGSLFAPREDGGLEMSLFETVEADVVCKHDYFNPAPREGSKGVRVLVK